MKPSLFQVDRGLSFAEACGLREAARKSEAETLAATSSKGGGGGGGTDMRRWAKQAAEAGSKFTGFWVQKQKLFGKFSVLLAVRTFSASTFASNKTRIWRAGVGEHESMDLHWF